MSFYLNLIGPRRSRPRSSREGGYGNGPWLEFEFKLEKGFEKELAFALAIENENPGPFAATALLFAKEDPPLPVIIKNKILKIQF